jgi:3-oxoisoapionate decarboxylase
MTGGRRVGRLGVGSFAFAWAIGVPGHPPARPMDAFAFLDRAAALGAEVAQLGDNLPLQGWTAGELERLGARAAALGLTLEVGTRGIEGDHLPHYAEVARTLDSGLLRVVIDTERHRPSPDEVVATLRRALPALERTGVTLALENHDRFPVATLAAIVREVGSERVGICLDTVNSLGSLEGPDTVLDALGPLVVNFHVKDARIERLSHNMGFLVSGTPAGQGMLDLPGMLRRLADLGRAPNVILESWPPPEDDIEATIRKEAAWAEESMPYLRSVLAELTTERAPGATPPGAARGVR